MIRVERKPCAHHKKTGLGEHFNTKHGIEKLIRCRKLMQPPHRMKAKDVAAMQGIPYATMMRKLEEYGV